MDQFFWESTHTAQREHFCDWCCSWIQPGEIYTRKAWVPKKGLFHIMKEHRDPACPIEEEERVRGPLSLSVPMAIVTEIRMVAVAKQVINGSIHIEYVPTLFPVAVPLEQIENSGSQKEHDEVPF